MSVELIWLALSGIAGWTAVLVFGFVLAHVGDDKSSSECLQ